MYDFNGNLVTFLYLGNRIDIDYDSADRVRNFGKGQDGSPQSGSSPYVTDLRGFVVQRGDEHLNFNILGQLLTASRPNRYEVHYAYDYQDVDGIQIATQRRVFAFDAQKRKIPDPVLVSIDLSEISFS